MFTIIWDKRLVPKKRAQPFDYEPPFPKTVDKEIIPLDLQNYLVEYMKVSSSISKHLKRLRSEPSPPSTEFNLQLLLGPPSDALFLLSQEDNLGQIGISWLALSDKYGPSHPYCLQLCEFLDFERSIPSTDTQSRRVLLRSALQGQLHSFAVDYPKTGVSASLPVYLRSVARVSFLAFASFLPLRTALR